MQKTMTVVEAIGVLNDAKFLRHHVGEVLKAASKPKNNRLLYGSQRESEVIKINPTASINDYRKWRKELDNDIANIQAVVFTFNATKTLLPDYNMTVSEALREVERAKGEATSLSREIQDNTSYSRAPEDEIATVDIVESSDEMLAAIKKSRALKDAIAAANNSNVEVVVENVLLERIL